MFFLNSCREFFHYVSAVNMSLQVVLTRQHLFMCLLAVNCGAIYFLLNVLINHSVTNCKPCLLGYWGKFWLEDKCLGIRKSTFANNTFSGTGEWA